MTPRWGEVPERIEEMVNILDVETDKNFCDYRPNVFELEKSSVVKRIRERGLVARLRFEKKFETKLNDIRYFLEHREKMREFSTRSYYIVRKYLIELGRRFVNDKTLECEKDVFFLPVDELIKICKMGCITRTQKRKLAYNKKMYNSYKQFSPPNEFGKGIAINETAVVTLDGMTQLSGIACSPGIYTGMARVILDLKDVSNIKEGDILITKFTDPGWTPVLGIVKGIITEVGGVLSHAAVIGREYGTPAVLNVKNVTKAIQSGQSITIDGSSGKVILG